MMAILLKFLKYWANRLVRHGYWLYNLSRIKGIGSCAINFPVVVEGKGKIVFGKDGIIANSSSMKVALHGNLVFKDSLSLGSFVDIRIANEASLTGGNRCSIGNNSRLFINNNWVLGNNANIATNCSIFSREAGLFGSLTMFDNSYIADNCIIDVSDDVIIGSDVAIGPNCVFYTHDHEYNDLTLPAWNGAKITGKIIVGDKTWIGSNVTILPDVTIGKHVVIAAGSVVTHSIPDNVVCAGVPARIIKKIE